MANSGRGDFRSLQRILLPLCVTFLVALLAAVPHFLSSPRWINLLILGYIYLTLATSWNIIGGYAGQINLGHAAFFGIGAYACALLFAAGLSIYAGILLGGVAAVLLSILTWPFFRLKHDYFAIGTLVLTEVASLVFFNFSIAGGASGFYLPVPQNNSLESEYYLAFCLAAAASVCSFAMARSNLGLSMCAVRDDEAASAVLGLNPFKYKVVALALSSFWAGAAGAFYARYMLFVQPMDVFGLIWSSLPLMMVIIGGSGSQFGPIIGATLYTLLAEFTTGLGRANSIFMGALLIATVLFAPGGLVGLLKLWWTRESD